MVDQTPEARLAAALPCTKKDWPEDSCDHWVEKYDQEPCDNCALRRTIAAALALAAAIRRLINTFGGQRKWRIENATSRYADEDEAYIVTTYPNAVQHRATTLIAAIEEAMSDD